MTSVKGLNLGCGTNIIQRPGESWVNTDRVWQAGVDLVHDLEIFPWPWPRGFFSEVIARDVFEHISASATTGFMVECHRVLALDGVLELRVPDWRHENAWTDPTHQRACTEHTFDYWIAGTELYERHNTAYGDVTFCLDERHLDGYDWVVRLRASV
jgi:predicted SAM-dependent methyltransferase